MNLERILRRWRLVSTCNFHSFLPIIKFEFQKSSPPQYSLNIRDIHSGVMIIFNELSFQYSLRCLRTKRSISISISVPFHEHWTDTLSWTHTHDFMEYTEPKNRKIDTAGKTTNDKGKIQICMHGKGEKNRKRKRKEKSSNNFFLSFLVWLKLLCAVLFSDKNGDCMFVRTWLLILVAWFVAHKTRVTCY